MSGSTGGGSGFTVSAADLPDDACKDAVDLIATNFAESGEDYWRITTPEAAEPLVGARSVTGALVIYGEAIDVLPEFPCLESIDTLWIQKTRLRDLTAFSGLDRVTEYVEIDYNNQLDDLEGLGALREVGKSFVISGNDGLTSLAGLTSLQRVETLGVRLNDALVDLPGMPSVSATSIEVSGKIDHVRDLAVTSADGYTITSARLESLEGLPVKPKMRQIVVGGAFTSLAPLASLEEITKLQVAGAIHLETLDGLQNLRRVVDGEDLVGALLISGNDKLRDISALSNVTFVEDSLEVSNNLVLETLHGLEGIDAVKKLAIRANSGLISLDAIRQGTPLVVSEWLRITTNALLPECQAQAICEQSPGAECIVGNNDTDSTDGCG